MRNLQKNCIQEYDTDSDHFLNTMGENIEQHENDYNNSPINNIFEIYHFIDFL